MNGYIFGRILETGLIIILVLVFVSIITVALYDILMTHRHKQAPKILRNQPHITVLVYAFNNEATIAQSLKSLLRNTYRHFDVVVVDDRSNDHTYKEVKVIQAASKTKLVLYKKRKAAPRQAVLTQAYKKSQHGELVFVTDGTMLVSKTFLRQVAVEYRASPTDTMTFNEYHTIDLNLSAIPTRFGQLSRHLVYKILALVKFKQKAKITRGLYKKEIVIQSSTAKLATSYHGQQTIKLMQAPLYSLRNKSTVIHIILMLLFMLFVIYALYTAIYLHNPALLFFSWLAVSIWFLASIWFDEAASMAEKATLTISLPPLYFVIFLTCFFQLPLITYRGFLTGVKRSFM